MATVSRVFVYLIIVVTGLQCITSQSDETVLKVTPYGTAVEVGETVELKCTHYPEDILADATLEWYMPHWNIPISELVTNQSVINATNSDILRFSSENGTLTIVNTTKHDSGDYVCKTQDHLLEVTAQVKVYVMPSYFTEAMVVIGINAVLIVIFFACTAWTNVRDRRQNKLRKRQERLGHKEMAK